MTDEAASGAEKPGDAATRAFAMPRGTVVRFDRQRGFGFVQSQRGQSLFFYLPTVDFIGPLGSRALQVGAVVGYDVTLTSKGERVTKMRIYEGGVSGTGGASGP